MYLNAPHLHSSSGITPTHATETEKKVWYNNKIVFAMARIVVIDDHVLN